MIPRAVDLLLCPTHGHRLTVVASEPGPDGAIRDGWLACEEAGCRWPIRNFIPRLTEGGRYIDSFGLQWNRYREVQLDRRNGTTLSRDRLLRGTGWSEGELAGQRILEVGCGAGRFTEVMLAADAEVFAIDYSVAVDACWQNHGPHPRLQVAQADLYTNPFVPGSFDRVLCYGVLQHLPDVKAGFMSLLSPLKSGGHLAVDVYRKPSLSLRHVDRYWAKYWWSPLTRRLPPELLARIIEWYVPRWLPVDTALARVPKVGALLTAIVPCWNYTGWVPLAKDQIAAWAILDTFDALAPRYDQPQSFDDVRRWFEEAGLVDIDVRLGGNGVIGNGRKP